MDDEATARAQRQPMRRELAAIWAVAFAASAIVGTHGLAYWDAGDYVRLALEGGTSGLLLGRPLFLWVSHAIVLAMLRLHVDPSWAEPVLRWFWCAVSATAAPAFALLCARVAPADASDRAVRRAAMAGGLCLALSPSFAHTAHQVLTDGAALSLSIVAVLLAFDGRAVLAGVMLACAVATRETAAVQAIAIVLLLRGRGSVVRFAVAAAVLLGLVVVASHGGSPSSLRAWIAAMGKSGEKHPLGLRDVGLSLAWIVAASPIAVPLGARALVKERPRGELAMVVLPSLVATLLLVFYPDGAFSPRYALATAPFAFFLLAAPALAAAPTRAAFALAVPWMLVPLATTQARAIARRAQAIPARVSALPDRTLIVPGHFCPQVQLALAVERARGARNERSFRLVCPGWAWPDAPAPVLEAARRDGWNLAIDVAEEAWIGPREAAPRAAMRAFVSTHPSFEVAGFAFIAAR